MSECISTHYRNGDRRMARLCERWKRSTDNTIATGAREDASKDQTTPAWRPVDVYFGHDRQGDY